MNTTIPKLMALTEFEGLLMMADKKVFQKGEMIFKEETTDPYFYIVLKGRVGIGKSVLGGIKMIAEVGEGDFLGEGMLIGTVQKPASAIALSKVTVLRLNKEHFDRFRKEEPNALADFLLAVLRISNERLQKTDTKLMTLFEISALLNLYRYDLKDLAAAIVHKLLEMTGSKEGLLMIRESDQSYRLVYSTSSHFNEKALGTMDFKKSQQAGGVMVADLQGEGVLAFKRQEDYEDDDLRFLILVADQVSYNLKEAARQANEQARRLLQHY